MDLVQVTADNKLLITKGNIMKFLITALLITISSVSISSEFGGDGSGGGITNIRGGDGSGGGLTK